MKNFCSIILITGIIVLMIGSIYISRKSIFERFVKVKEIEPRMFYPGYENFEEENPLNEKDLNKHNGDNCPYSAKKGFVDEDENNPYVEKFNEPTIDVVNSTLVNSDELEYNGLDTAFQSIIQEPSLNFEDSIDHLKNETLNFDKINNTIFDAKSEMEFANKLASCSSNVSKLEN